MSEHRGPAEPGRPRSIWLVLTACAGISVLLSELVCLLVYAALGMTVELDSATGRVMVLAPAILPAVISPLVYWPLVRSRRRGMVLLGELQRTTAALAAEVDRRRLAQGRLEYNAMHDELTGLRNRRGFFDGTPGLVTGLCVVIDIDSFKYVNDEYGHAAGDRALTAVAQATREITDEHAVVARLGGDELAIFDTTPDETIIRRLVRALRTVEVQMPDYRFTVSASVGGALLTEPTPIDDALALADAEMYREKSRRHTTGEANAGSPIG